MKYIKENSMNLSQICLGVSKYGTRIDMDSSYEMMDIFVEKGGSLFDTARNYYEWVENGRGKSEEALGKYLEDRNLREKVYIATKGGVKNDGKIWRINLSEENLLNELKESLEALRSEYIDIYLLHRDQIDLPVGEIVESMQKIAEVAKVNSLGVCNWRVNRIKEANEYAIKHNMKPFTIIQTWWSLAEYTESMWNDPNTTHMDDRTYKYLVDNNLIGMAYTSQVKGFFQKAIRNGIDNVDYFLKERIATPNNIKKLDYIKCYCEEKQISPTAVINGYITSNLLRGIAMVSCSNLGQLNDVLNNCSYVLDEKIINELDSII